VGAPCCRPGRRGKNVGNEAIQTNWRAKFLAVFERSGLIAAAFARQHRLNYTTFCGWRQRRAKIKSPPAFVEVEVPAATAPVDLSAEASA